MKEDNRNEGVQEKACEKERLEEQVVGTNRVVKLATTNLWVISFLTGNSMSTSCKIFSTTLGRKIS